MGNVLVTGAAGFIGGHLVELLLARESLSSGPSMRVDETAIEHMLRRGNKIEAIKIYREKTGVGLKEAKDAVEAIERRLG